MMTWFWQGILRFGSPLLVLTVVACGGSESRQMVLAPPTPSTTNLPALPDQVSQANLYALVDLLPDSLFVGETLELPTQSFLFPASLFSLTITITDPDGEVVVIVLTPELLGCNAAATVCTSPATSLVLPELKPETYSLRFEAIDQNGIPYGADKEIEAQEQELEDTPRPAPFNPNPGPLPDPAGTPTPSPSPGASPTPTPEPSPTADPGAESVPGFDSQPARRSTINVGSALIGQEISTSLTMIEIGNASLQVEASITGREASDFQIEPESFLIPDGGANQVATITCTPNAVRSRAAILTLTTNDPARPTVSYPLICEGLAIPVAGFSSTPVSGSTIDLGSSTLNTATGSQILKISNTGSAKLKLGSAQLTGTNPDDFTISPDTAFDIEASGADVEVTITCTPGGLGSRTAKLEFTTNVPNNLTVSYDLECEGIRSDRVNTINDDDPTGTKLATCTLREAIEAVNATADNNIFGGCEITNSTISFANSLLNQTITVQNSVLPTIHANVTIQGLGKEAQVLHDSLKGKKKGQIC